MRLRLGAVDLRRLPAEPSALIDGGDDEPASTQPDLVEQLYPLGLKDVEAICPKVLGAKVWEASGVDVLGGARLLLAGCMCRSEELDPAVGPPPSLLRVIDGDRGTGALGEVAGMSGVGIGEPDELETRTAGEVGRIDVGAALGCHGREREQRRRLQEIERRRLKALARDWGL